MLLFKWQYMKIYWDCPNHMHLKITSSGQVMGKPDGLPNHAVQISKNVRYI